MAPSIFLLGSICPVASENNLRIYRNFIHLGEYKEHIIQICPENKKEIDQWKPYKIEIEGNETYRLPDISYRYNHYTKEGLENGLIFPTWKEGVILHDLWDDDIIAIPCRKSMFSGLPRLTKANEMEEMEIETLSKYIFGLQTFVKFEKNHLCCFDYKNDNWCLSDSLFNYVGKTLANMFIIQTIQDKEHIFTRLYKFAKLAQSNKDRVSLRKFFEKKSENRMASFSLEDSQEIRLRKILENYMKANNKLPQRSDIIASWRKHYPSWKENQNSGKRSNFADSKALEDSPKASSRLSKILDTYGFTKII